MNPALPRTHFNSSRLVRVLTDLALIEPREPAQNFAEQLGQWLGVNDAIRLSAAIGLSGKIPAASAARRTLALAEELDGIREQLAGAIRQSFAHDIRPGQRRIKLPSVEDGDLDLANPVMAYEPLRRFYLAHQRDMDIRIRALRVRAREVLATTSPALKALANLDAILDDALSAQENKSLAALPALLEKRFQHTYNAHGQAPATGQATPAWLSDFCRDMQTLLLAELDLRLQPTIGLIAAFSNQTSLSQ